jgi:hypothetical protein
MSCYDAIWAKSLVCVVVRKGDGENDNVRQKRILMNCGIRV